MSSLIWVDKYKPTKTSEIIGQSQNISRVKSWLKTYDSSKSRPLFIYGPPGIGKTTAVHLCCKEAGYKTVEFNASDQRNKNIIKEIISTLSNNSRLNFFGRASETKDAIILDEIDGMAGNEDRGGIAQLMIEMKNTKKPMIFICNDGQHQKLRSLKDKCEVIEFRKPDYNSIKAVVSRIAQQEGLRMDTINIKNLAESSDFDIRQIVNSLSLFKNGSSDQISKTTRMNAFEATKKVLTTPKLTLDEKFECFFSDYNIMPLFVFENYLKKGDLKAISKAADSLCLSDLAEKEIRSKQNWSLLNTQALLSTVIPSTYAGSCSMGRVDFPQFLGKLSNANKRLRLLQELNSHMCLSLRGGLDPDYLEVMQSKLSGPLIKDGVKGIDSVIDFMHDYSLLRDDFNSMMELASWSFKQDPMLRVDTKTKTAFTLAYKKRSIALPYFSEEGKAPSKKKKAVNLFGDDNLDEDEEEEEDEDVAIKPKRVVKASADKGKKAKKEKEEKKVKKEDKKDEKKEEKKEKRREEKKEEKKPDKRPPNGIAQFFVAKKQRSF